MPLSHSQQISYNDAVGRLSPCPTGDWVKSDYSVMIHKQEWSLITNHVLYSHPTQTLKRAFPSGTGIHIPPEKIQTILSSKHGKGYIIAGLLGAITPFCSCSTIPFLKGLLRANAGFGTMMVFLFASPLLNPIIIGLFAVTFGIDVTIFYFVMAMGVSIIFVSYLVVYYSLYRQKKF